MYILYFVLAYLSSVLLLVCQIILLCFFALTNYGFCIFHRYQIEDIEKEKELDIEKDIDKEVCDRL